MFTYTLTQNLKKSKQAYTVEHHSVTRQHHQVYCCTASVLGVNRDASLYVDGPPFRGTPGIRSELLPEGKPCI